MANPDEEDFRGTERFHVERRLGAGAFGVVYEAYDRDNARKVALKVLRPYGNDAVYRFKHEFRALADISHPNLVTLFELLSDADRWFFTMELVEGVNFLDYVRGPGAIDSGPRVVSPTARTEIRSPDEPLIDGEGQDNPTASTGEISLPDLGRLRSILVQAVCGIRALHESGKLHRDIKPMNVLVTREGRVVLLDFGLVTDLDPEERDRSLDLAGTPAYMSPEQGTGVPISEASDWYSLGVMLYEALTGRRPFVGSFAELLIQKQECALRRPRDLAPAIPEDLDQLCTDLLRRPPGDRPTGEEIAKRLGEPARSLEDTGVAAHVAAPFVGRGTELDALKRAFSAAQEGRAIEVHVHGSSGIGKTALVRQFLDGVRWSTPAVVLTGRCYERESVPFKALDSLIDALSRHLKGIAGADVEALLPRDVPALLRLFPVLKRVESVGIARRRVMDIPDSRELRRRGFAALRELLARLADRKPVVLFIDDLHWGDVDSALLLTELLRPPDAPAVLFVLAYRSEEADSSPLLQQLLGRGSASEIREIHLRELAKSEARELALALLAPSTPPEQVDAIALESAGSPFFIDELARYARVEASARIPPERIGKTTLDSVIHARIARLPEDARRALQLVAVAGQPIEIAILREASTPEIGPNAIGILRSNRLIRSRRTSDRHEIEPYHDRIREAVLAQTAPETLRDDHLRLALAWEASRRVDPETLMLHFEEAGQVEKAAEYAALAAARASTALAFDRAARLYSRAIELGAERDRGGRRDLQVLQAHALANAGRGADAAKAYLAAIEGAPAAEALELQRRAAEQFLRSGHLHEGVPILRSLLERTGLVLAETPRQAFVSLLLGRARVALRGLSFRERDETQISAEELLRIDTCWSIIGGYALIDLMRARDVQSRHLLLALEAGEPYRVALALACEAGLTSTEGQKTRKRVERLLKIGGAVAHRVQHPHAIAMMEFASGIAAYMQGRWKKGWEHGERAERLFRERCTGVAWELNTTHVYSLRALFYLGRISDMSVRLPQLVREALERDDLFAATSLRTRHATVVALAADEPESAREDLREAMSHWSSREFQMQHYFSVVAEAEIALYEGNGAVARQRLQDRWAGLRRSLMLRSQLFRVESKYLQGRCAVSAALTANSGDQEELLRSATTEAAAIEKERLAWGTPLAKLLRAGVSSIRRSSDDTVRLLQEAEREFAAADMALHATIAKKRRGSLVGGEEGRVLLDPVGEWMRTEGIRNPDAMAAMLAPGRWEPTAG